MMLCGSFTRYLYAKARNIGDPVIISENGWCIGIMGTLYASEAKLNNDLKACVLFSHTYHVIRLNQNNKSR